MYYIHSSILCNLATLEKTVLERDLYHLLYRLIKVVRVCFTWLFNSIKLHNCIQPSFYNRKRNWATSIQFYSMLYLLKTLCMSQPQYLLRSYLSILWWLLKKKEEERRREEYHLLWSSWIHLWSWKSHQY